MAECKEASNGLVDCEKEKARVVEEHTKSLQTYRTALETVAKCQDAKCLADALGSADPVVREKAAYAAVAKNDPEVLPALIGAVKRPCKEGGDIVARVAAVLATDWMVGNNADARARCKGEIKALQAVIETDSKVGLTTESTEEIKRLVDVIDHGREAVAAAPDAAAVTEEPEKEKEKAPAKPAARPGRKKGGRKGK